MQIIAIVAPVVFGDIAADFFANIFYSPPPTSDISSIQSDLYNLQVQLSQFDPNIDPPSGPPPDPPSDSWTIGSRSGAEMFFVGGVIASIATFIGVVKSFRIGISAELEGIPDPPSALKSLVEGTCNATASAWFNSVRITSDASACTLYVGAKRVLVVGLLLVKYLTREELGAVIAHECGHHHNGAMLPSRIHYRAYMFLRGFESGIIARMRTVFEYSDSGWRHVSDAVAFTMLPQLVLLRFYIFLMKGLGALLGQPDYEYYCDYVAARAFGSRAMALALRKVSDLSIVLAPGDKAMSAAVGRSWLCLVNDKYSRLQDGFDQETRYMFDESESDTHPSLSSRLDRLESLSIPTPSGSDIKRTAPILSASEVDDLWTSLFDN